MAAPDRELVITYNSFSVGGSTGRHPHGKIRIEDSFTRGAIEFTVVIRAASQSAFATACAAIEAAYRTPYKTLSVTMGGETFLSLDADGALEAMPSITKEGDDFDTGLSRAYRCRVEYERPADNVTTSGLRSRAVTISYSPSRRRIVTITGTYTAVSGTDARAKYEAGIAALASSVLSAIDGSAAWDLVEETSGPNSTNDKTMDFSRSYEEILYSQAGSSPDRTNIVRQSLRIAVRDVDPGDTPTATRLTEFDVSYSAWIDSEQTTDLAAEWAVISPWLVTQVKAFGNITQVAVTSREVRYIPDDNRIEAALTVQGFSGDSRIENLVTVQDDDEKGLVHVPIWSGDPLDVLEHQGIRVYLRTVTSETVFQGKFGINSTVDEAVKQAAEFTDDPRGVSGGEWRVLRVTPSARHERIGLADVGTFISVMRVKTVTVMRYVKRRTGSDIAITGGGGSAPPTTP